LYSLEFTPEALDDLSHLDRSTAQRVFNRLRWLADNFESLTPEALTGDWEGLFKLRIGGFRALYTLDQTDQILTVHVIRHRREVYKRR
jgi:mRNA interferase RelE/StbE